jgi:hypothetical protein
MCVCVLVRLVLTRTHSFVLLFLPPLLFQNQTIEAENRSLKRENADISRQVQVLLHECSVAAGKADSSMESSPDPALLPGSAGSGPLESAGSGQSVITARLVTFRDIQQLQQRNQELLQVARSLTEQQERHEAAQYVMVVLCDGGGGGGDDDGGGSGDGGGGGGGGGA